MGSELRVEDVMSQPVITVNKGKTIEQAAKVMKKNEVGSVIVVTGTKTKRALGIITERDIVHKVIAEGKDAKKTKVEDVMSQPLLCIDPDATLEEAARAMRKEGVKRLPVLEGDNLVGIISEADILRIFPAVIDLVEERAALM